jgi:hypothetical protein
MTINLATIAASTSPFLKSEGETCFRTLDGSDVAQWLKQNGYTVTSNRDTGRNGIAITACGFSVSTNGHVAKVAA